MKIVIATIKSWNIENARKFMKKYSDEHDVFLIEKKEDLNLIILKELNPDYIFFPHWSYMIPSNIFEKYCCVVFHMTDLPFGRGGSPLQNLIVRGLKETKISALRVTKEVDAGPVYMKEKLELSGSAEEIFKRCSNVIFEKMIPTFLKQKLVPVEQQGEAISFVRRKPEESQLKEEMSVEKIYDYIRMLDAEGYPNAYIDFGKYRLSFQNAKLENGQVSAEVRFVEVEK